MYVYSLAAVSRLEYGYKEREIDYMKEFLAINESTLIVDTEVDCDLYVKSLVNGIPRYVLFSRGGEMFRSDRRRKLVENNITKLYVYANSYKTFNDYQEQN